METTPPDAPRLGRPPKAPEVRTRSVAIELRKVHVDLIQGLAARRGVSKSSAARLLLELGALGLGLDLAGPELEVQTPEQGLELLHR